MCRNPPGAWSGLVAQFLLFFVRKSYKLAVEAWKVGKTDWECSGRSHFLYQYYFITMISFLVDFFLFVCLFVSNYWLDLCFIFQFVLFGLVHLTSSVLFCVASHGQGLSASLLGVLGRKESFCQVKDSNSA